MRFESALQIVGALKRRFGEPMTVADICRELPLSYQPVYEYVRRLAQAQVVSLRKTGQRLLCEPACTPAGSLWLAHYSVHEAQSSSDARVRELAGALQGRMEAGALSATAIAALDPHGRGELWVTESGLGNVLARAPVRVTSPERLVEWLRGENGRWEVARRAIPLAGQQQLWWLALAAREAAAGRSATPRPVRRQSIFSD